MRVCSLTTLTCLFEPSRLGKHSHRDLGPQNFYEYNLNQDNPKAGQALCQFTMLARQKYRLPPAGDPFLASQVALEEIGVKRYTGGTEQQFSDHVDVGDCSSAKRYLAFLFYLNDDFEGGETLFYPGTVIEPKKGSVVVFPPTWAYPHKVCPSSRDQVYYVFILELSMIPTVDPLSSRTYP